MSARKPSPATGPVNPPSRFVIDDKGKRVPVPEGEDIVAAAYKAKGLPVPGTKPEPKEN